MWQERIPTPTHEEWAMPFADWLKIGKAVWLCLQGCLQENNHWFSLFPWQQRGCGLISGDIPCSMQRFGATLPGLQGRGRGDCSTQEGSQEEGWMGPDRKAHGSQLPESSLLRSVGVELISTSEFTLSGWRKRKYWVSAGSLWGRCILSHTWRARIQW